LLTTDPPGSREARLAGDRLASTERLSHRAPDQLMDRFLFRKANFTLRGMHIHIHTIRIDF
jgi:hypothetical protein